MIFQDMCHCYHQLKVAKGKGYTSIWIFKQKILKNEQLNCCHIFEELNTSTTIGCVLKNVEKSSDDILINDSCKIRKMKLCFNKFLNIEIYVFYKKSIFSPEPRFS